jgi:DNA gyrase subunit A
MEKVIQQNIVDMYNNDMTIYKIATIRKRVVPDYRDGQKEVSRRILDVMANDESRSINNPVKSAKIVGTTMGKSHPHGNTSIYDKIKNMVNWFDVNLPLIDSESNFGNFQGDGQAADRYTEIKLSKFSKDYIIKDMLEVKQVTNWNQTYNGIDYEPEYLPVKVPLLLINGNFGIAVGLQSYIPPHPVNEVIDATLKLMDDPNAEIILVPEQNMPCQIIDTDWKSICNTGNGKFIVRGNIIIDEYRGAKDPRDKKGKKMLIDKRYVGCQTLVIRSLPDMVSLNSIEEDIEKLMKEGAIPQIIDSIPDSDEFQPNHIFVLKKGSDPNYVREFIYSKTQMQKTFSVNMEAMNGIELLRFSYKSYLEAWIDFAKIIKLRYYCNKLQKAKTNLHEKEAYIKAYRSGMIDEIISMIRKKKTTDDNELMEFLIKKLDITDLQAHYIMNSGLKNLSEGYVEKFEQEAIELIGKINTYMNFITNEQLMINEIKQDLLNCKTEHGSKRRSVVIKSAADSDIPAGEFKIVITENNFIKKIVATDNAIAIRGDKPKFTIKLDNRDSLYLFNEQGKVFKYPVHKIPLTDKTNSGFDLRMIIKNNTSSIIKIMSEEKLTKLSKKTNKYFVVILTQGNMVKKIDITDILSAVPSGIIYTKLKDDDVVKDVQIIPESLDIIIYSDRKALRCPMNQIPHYKKMTIGVNAMDTKDMIDGMSAIYPDATDIVVVTASGKVNRFDVTGLEQSSRYKAGSSVIKLGNGDKILSIFGAKPSDILRVVTANNVFKHNINEIPYATSVSTGTKLIPLKGDNIVKCDIIIK